LEPGETWLQAAAREIVEETGITDFELGPIVWRREGVLNIPDPRLFDERYIVARCEGAEPNRDGWDALERDQIDDIRWWTLAELASTQETVFPAAWPACFPTSWPASIRPSRGSFPGARLHPTVAIQRLGNRPCSPPCSPPPSPCPLPATWSAHPASRAAPGAAVDALPMNAIQVIGTHNSYKMAIAPRRNGGAAQAQPAAPPTPWTTATSR
jgi:hypothetical protein